MLDVFPMGFLHFYFGRSRILHGIWCQSGQAVNSGDPVSIPESNVICFPFFSTALSFPTFSTPILPSPSKSPIACFVFLLNLLLCTYIDCWQSVITCKAKYIPYTHTDSQSLKESKASLILPTSPRIASHQRLPMAQPPSGQRPVVQPCRYKTGKTLGAGSYSVVKECVHIDTGRYYAAKVINKRLMAGREHMVRNEIAVLKRVSMGHQNILTLVDYFETMNNLYLVTDLALGGELFDRICRKGSYFESDAADLIRAVLSAVAYLHDHGIVHRDLKPENLLFRTPEDNADLLIADFGLSRIMDEEQFHVLTTTCGTPGYMAPEIFKKSGHGKPVDIWAIGVITYFLLCGYTPFDRDSNLEEMQAILAADYSFTPLEYWRGVSQEARNFINRCLTIDPQKRMTAHEALQHVWVNPPYDSIKLGSGEDLLPTVKKNFNARRTLHRAIDTVRAINKLREGGGFMMDGVMSIDPKPERVNGQEVVEEQRHGTPGDPNDGGSPMQIDSRGNARGQTEEQIREQERRVKEMVAGLWSRGHGK